jgi:hypothetical protein
VNALRVPLLLLSLRATSDWPAGGSLFSLLFLRSITSRVVAFALFLPLVVFLLRINAPRRAGYNYVLDDVMVRLFL